MQLFKQIFLYLHYRGEEFRTAFKNLGTLKVFFPEVPLVGLSGTLTIEQKIQIPKLLNLNLFFFIIESTPDKPNIYLDRCKKKTCDDVLGEYESTMF